MHYRNWITAKKVRREASAHKDKKLNDLIPQMMESACKEYWDSMEPGYKGKPVSLSSQFFIYFFSELLYPYK